MPDEKGLWDTLGQRHPNGAQWIKTRAEVVMSVYVIHKSFKKPTEIIFSSRIKLPCCDYCHWNDAIALVLAGMLSVITPLGSFLLEALNARCKFLWLLKMGRPIDYDLIYWISWDRPDYTMIANNPKPQCLQLAEVYSGLHCTSTESAQGSALDHSPHSRAQTEQAAPT